jgi:2-haloacid dehalogenase
MPGRWVTFDCYGTIVDWNTALVGALREVFGDEAPATLEGDFHDAEKRVKHGDDGYHRYRDVLAASVREMAAGRGHELREGEADVLGRAWGTIAPFADAATGLGGLRDRGFRLAILTNCDDDLFALTRAQLPVPMDEVVTAEQVRSYKPDHAHFEEFRRRVQPDAWVHAANSWEHDVVPAAELGLPRIWVDRDRSGHDASLASVRIEDFARLAEEADRLAGG